MRRNNITLSKDYSQERVNRDTQIEGNCKTESCDEMFCKTFRRLTRSGGFCKLCTGEFRKNNIKQNCLEKHGCENSSQRKEVKDKIKQTNLKKFGCENPMQNEEVRDKGKQTNLKKFGCENPSQNEDIKQQKQNTCFENYGVKIPYQSEEVREKGRQTNLKNHGVNHHMQNGEIAEKVLKSSYKSKDYKLPSGNIIKMQGYEHFALDELLQNISEEEDVITGRNQVPEIWYLDSSAKKHRYYVDVFIPSQKKMIEVKCEYTFKVGHDIILLKQRACKDAGYLCEIWVYNAKGEKVECIL